MSLSEPFAGLIALGGVALGSTGLVIGQTDPAALGWTQVLGGMTSLGFAVWYAYYTTTVTIPKMQERHAEEMREKDKVHAEVVNRMLNEFRAECRESRQALERATDRPAG